MADSSTASSSLWFGYRPAVFATTGLVVAYSIYTLYNTLSTGLPSGNSLHRSNAVHRPRRNRPQRSEGLDEVDSDDVDVAETEEGLDDAQDTESSQALRGLVYYIAEDNARRQGYQHHGIMCSECGQLPIREIRWHCLMCHSFDLCSTCEQGTTHPKTHVFAKIKVPLPFMSQPKKTYQPWYQGDPSKVRSALDLETKRSLCEDFEFDEPQLDALYDQFICTANVSWPDDPCGVFTAIDLGAFRRALVPEHWPVGAVHNLLLDRVFALFDEDNNRLIGFREFLSGSAYLRGPSRFNPLDRALRGFDLDGDGYLCRKDFRRLLLAHFQLQRFIIMDMIDDIDLETEQDMQDVVTGSQPISSMFRHDEIPPGEIRQPQGKRLDAFGDMQPVEGVQMVVNVDNSNPVPSFGPVQAPDQIPDFQELLSESNNKDADETRPEDDVLIDTYEGFTTPEFGASGEMVDTTGVWEGLEAGMSHIFDNIFRERELQDNAAIRTRQERAKWRTHIDQAVTLIREDPEASKSLAQQSSSYSSLGPHEDANGAIGGHSTTVINPTDIDTTLPQNMPNSSSHEPQATDLSPLSLPIETSEPDDHRSYDYNIDTSSSERVPSHLRLLFLAHLDRVDEELLKRPAPGMLTIEEIRDIALDEAQGEIRGLIKSWLEMADF